MPIQASNDCKNCCNRHFGCHGVCESYKKYKEELERIRKNYRKDQIWGAFKYESTVKSTGREGKWR